MRAFSSVAKLVSLVFSLLFCTQVVAVPISEEPSRVYYQVYVRAFFDGSSTPDQLGDFRGLTAKLDHLQDLGVNALLLMPVFKSTGGMGYIPVDFFKLDSAYGSEDDLKELIAAAHARDIKILLDAPVNHISDNSEWFQKSLKKNCEPGQAGGEFCDFFYFSTDPCTELPFANWHKPWNWSRTTCKDVWFSYYAQNNTIHRAQKYYATFFQGMPDLNFWNFKSSSWNTPVVNEIQRFFFKWSEIGVDGFRIDAAKHFVEGRQNNSNEIHPNNLALLKNFMDTTRARFPNVSFLAEAWAGYDVTDVYTTKATDAVLDFGFMDSIRDAVKNADAGKMRGVMNYHASTQATIAFGKRVVFAGNHDVSRLYTEFEGDENKIKLAHFVTLLQPTSPLFLYGEELGMEGKVKRPDPTKPEDKEEYVHTVFAYPWNAQNTLPAVGVPENYRTHNLELAVANPQSFWHFVKDVLSVRQQMKLTPKTKLFMNSSSDDGATLSYTLVAESGACFVIAANFSASKATTIRNQNINGCQPNTQLFSLRSQLDTNGASEATITLQPRGLAVLSRN